MRYSSSFASFGCVMLCTSIYNHTTIFTCSCKYIIISRTTSNRKMLGPFATASRLTPIHQVLLAVLSRAACASMSTTTTTTTRDRGDRYGPMEWAQQPRRHITIQQQAEVVFWSNMIHYLHLVWPETHFQLSTQNVSYLQHTTIKSIIALMGTDQVY